MKENTYIEQPENESTAPGSALNDLVLWKPAFQRPLIELPEAYL